MSRLLNEAEHVIKVNYPNQSTGLITGTGVLLNLRRQQQQSYVSQFGFYTFYKTN